MGRMQLLISRIFKDDYQSVHGSWVSGRSSSRIHRYISLDAPDGSHRPMAMPPMSLKSPKIDSAFISL